MISSISRKIHILTKRKISSVYSHREIAKLLGGEKPYVRIFNKIYTFFRLKFRLFHKIMKSHVTTMTKNYQIVKFVVASVSINMVNFKPSPFIGADRTAIYKILISFCSIRFLCRCISKAFVITIKTITRIPVMPFKFFSACFAYNRFVFSRFIRKVAFLRAKNLSVDVNLKLFTTNSTFFKNYGKLMTRRTFHRAKTSLFTPSLKDYFALFAYFFHISSWVTGEHPDGYSQYKQGVL